MCVYHRTVLSAQPQDTAKDARTQTHINRRTHTHTQIVKSVSIRTKPINKLLNISFIGKVIKSVFLLFWLSNKQKSHILRKLSYGRFYQN